MKFYFEVELGDDAMQTHEDVARAMEKTAEKVRSYAEPPSSGKYGRVMDENGNSVGSFGFLRE